MIGRFRKSVFHLGAGDPGDQRDSCLKNAGRFIQSSRADNAHEAGDRSLSAYLMLVQQRRRVCVEAHIDCHPCRHPSPLLHHRCPSPPNSPVHLATPSVLCTLHRESYYVSPYIPLNRSPCATRFGRQVYQQLVTTTSAGDINSDSIVVSRSAAPAGINIKLTLRSSLSRSIEPRVSHHRPTLPPPSTGNPSFQILNTIIFVHFSQRTFFSFEKSFSIRLVQGRILVVSACRGF